MVLRKTERPPSAQFSRTPSSRLVVHPLTHIMVTAPIVPQHDVKTPRLSSTGNLATKTSMVKLCAFNRPKRRRRVLFVIWIRLLLILNRSFICYWSIRLKGSKITPMRRNTWVQHYSLVEPSDTQRKLSPRVVKFAMSSARTFTIAAKTPMVQTSKYLNNGAGALRVWSGLFVARN